MLGTKNVARVLRADSTVKPAAHVSCKMALSQAVILVRKSFAQPFYHFLTRDSYQAPKPNQVTHRFSPNRNVPLIFRCTVVGWQFSVYVRPAFFVCECQYYVFVRDLIRPAIPTGAEPPLVQRNPQLRICA